MVERFGNYELLEKVAVGGMAEIFKARAIHGQGVEKLVCIKRIHPALSADKSFVAMFIDEARLGVKMVHGNIVPVFDFGYVDGHYFLAMEYVEGEDLASLCGRAQVVDMDWPTELAFFVTMEILEGLAYAHHKRDDSGRPLELVHRDVSPSNVLISNDGQVKLLDFGIARSQAREFETRTGVIKGKPGYMSPEQAAGMKVDARADVWSCGAVLHELVTGVKIKDGRQDSGDEQIDSLLRKALAADREDRYQDARALQDAMADIMAERRWRPNAADLTTFIEQVRGSVAPGENWDMQSTAVEEHLAAALKEITGPGKTEPVTGEEPGEEIEDAPTQLATVSTDAGSDPATLAATAQLRPSSPAPEQKRSRVPLVAAVVGVLAVAAVLLYVSTREDGAEAGEQGQDPRTAGEDDPQAKSPGSATLASDPRGAEVWLDRSNTGEKTPAEIELTPGKHTIELRLTGHETWTHRVDVDPGQQVLLEPALKPLPARASITTVPQGGQVSVDGADRGKSPVTLDDLKPGKHTVTASMTGKLDAEQELLAEPGGDHQVVLELKDRPSGPSSPPQPKGKATLNVTTLPWADVTLDGRPIGRTPIRGRQIPAGKHKVVLTNPLKGFSKTYTFTVKAGESKLIKEQF
jgi:serine/threonine-protein kinase